MKIKKTLLVTFVILAGLAMLLAMVYNITKNSGQNEQLSGLLITLFISGLIGPMFFLPTYLRSKESYGLPTAFINYSLMILESVTMLLGLTLYGNAIGGYGQVYLLLIYAFFGFHIFSYPRKFLSSLVQLVIPLGYIILNVVEFKYLSHSNLGSFEIVYNGLFKNGFIFTWGLIIGGFLAFCKFWYLSLKPNKHQEELKNVNNLKTLYIPLILYIIFIFIPGIWYLSHGFQNFFINNSSILFYLLDIIYFAYIIYTLGQNFSSQLQKFLTTDSGIALPEIEDKNDDEVMVPKEEEAEKKE